MKTWHAIGALVAVTGGLVAVRSMDQRRHEAEIERLRAEMASLSTPASTPAPSPLRIDAAVWPSAPAAPRPEPNEAREPEAAVEEAKRDGAAVESRRIKMAELREKLESAFADERSDPAWSAQALAAAKRGLEATIPETSAVRAIDCRTSMCRIETSHQDLTSFQEFVQASFIDPRTHLWNGGYFTTRIEDPRSDQVTVVSYLAREGEELAPDLLRRPGG